jgi:hypothetical protein
MIQASKELHIILSKSLSGRASLKDPMQLNATMAIMHCKMPTS